MEMEPELDEMWQDIHDGEEDGKRASTSNPSVTAIDIEAPPETCTKLQDAAKEAKQRRADLLRALEKQSSFRARAKNSADGGYEELIVRYSLLVMICMTSSFALYLCVYVLYDWMVDFSPIDDVVNVWCIVLVSKKTNAVYHRLCFMCNACMKWWCRMNMNVSLQRRKSHIVQTSILELGGIGDEALAKCPSV